MSSEPREYTLGASPSCPVRYALVDKTGKTRMTCLGEGRRDHRGAAKAFVLQRKGRPIPEGWRVVIRGPVTTKPTTQTSARPK